jgi:Zn-dependent metalloprotease
MHPEVNPIHCIVPPHILRKLAQHDDTRLREVAYRTMTIAARLRGRRDVLSIISATAVPAGELRRTIFDAKHGADLPGMLVRGEGDPPSGDSAVNEAYDGLGATYDMYHDVFDRNSIDNRGLRLDATVHYNVDFDNAFWDGRQMIFGDGDGIIFTGFTKAIDVIGHELTHGVTQFDAGLEYHDQPGALNESISDVFGSLVKQYHLKQDSGSADWLIGQGILAPGINGVALRSMKAPGTAYDDPKLGKDPQPANMRGYVHTPDDNGGVHINSGIPNHAFYLVATAIGGNAWDDAGHIWYTALSRLKPKSDFADVANTTFSVAGELFGTGSHQQQAVRAAWTEVGIKIAGQAPRAVARRTARANGEVEVPLEKQLEKLSTKIDKLVEVLSKREMASR